MLLLLLWGNSYSAQAGPSLTTQEQQANAKRQQAELQRQAAVQSVQLESGRASDDVLVLPEEPDGFWIEQIELDVSAAPRFRWLQAEVSRYGHHHYGPQGLDALVRFLNSRIAARGYVTTTVVLPEQDMSGQQLYLRLVPGYIGKIRFAETQLYGTWHNAFPTANGNLLNVRDLEQGMEQMQQAGNQKVQMQLVPGKTVGTSDVVLSIERSKPWAFSLEWDDAGLTDTGRQEGSVGLTLYNPTGLNDRMSYTGSRDIEGMSAWGTKGYSFSYVLPLGRFTLNVDISYNEYHECVRTLVPYELKSASNVREAGRTGLLYRDQVCKVQGFFKLIGKERHTWIHGDEVGVQRQNTTAWRAGVLYRRYWGRTVLDANLYYQKGMPWMGAEAGTDDFFGSYPTTRYGLWGASLSLVSPVRFGQVRGRYSLMVRGQYMHDRLYGVEQFSIGGCYTVRGFDGEQTLAADNGWFVRNELSFPLGTGGLEAYTGLDYGRVWGADDDFLSGHELAGVVFGLLAAADGWQGDMFLGVPLYKPAGFRTAKTALGFLLTYSF